MASRKGREFETIIKLSGALDKSVLAAIDTVAKNLDQLEAAARTAAGAAGEMAGRIQDQGKALAAAKTKYASYVLAGEESSEAAQKLAREITEQSAELRRNEAALQAAEQAAERLTAETIEAVDAASAMAETITDQGKALAAAKKQYAAYVLEGEEGSEAAQKLAREIAEQSAELRYNEAALKAAERAAEALADTNFDVLDDVSAMTETINDQRQALTAAKKQYTACILAGTEGSEAAKYLAEDIVKLTEDLHDNEEALKDAERATEALVSKASEALSGASMLAGAIKDQSDALAKAKRQYASYVLAGEEGSEAAQKLADKIVKLNKDINRQKSALTAAEQAAERLTDKSDDAAKKTKKLGDAADKAEKHLGVMDITLGNLAAKGLETLIGKAVDATRSLFGLADSTRDYRTEVAKLETAARSAGVSTDYIRDKWQDLSAVLGDEGAITEGLDNLMAAGFTAEQDMNKIARIFEGAAIKWKDTLKFEGLSDSLQEWIGSGGASLTGNFAELLERLGYTLEDVQAQTVGMTDEQRRIYATSLLSAAGLGNLSDEYREQNAELIAAERATKSYEEGLARLGASIEPITTAVTAEMGEMLETLAPVIADTVELAMPFVENFLCGAVDMLQMLIPYVNRFADALLPILDQLLSNLLPPILDLLDVLIPPLLDLVTAILPPLLTLIEPLLPALTEIVGIVVPKIAEAFTILFDTLSPVIDMIAMILDWIGKGATWVVDLLFTDVREFLPTFASGGFTRGVSIAGEAGTEAVISFDPLYRDENLSYWAEAGRLLGADPAFTLTEESGDSYYEMGGVTFAPNIVIHGEADKRTVMEAIEAEYPEFIDMLEEWFRERGKPVYA